MNGENILGLEAEDLGVTDLHICVACNDTGRVSNAPEDCPAWEADAYGDRSCDCEIGVLQDYTEAMAPSSEVAA